ncbi:MAG: RluA family pseudouridine synthase [Planctomycetota bacterium]
MHAARTGIDVIHADDRVVVVRKPPGLLSVPGRGCETDPAKADCVRARVAVQFPDATGPMTAHRLDQDTSGLMVLALDAEAHRALSIQFQDRLVSKAYVALLDGWHEHLDGGTSGTIDFPIMVDWPNRPRKIHSTAGKPSLTRYRVDGQESWGELPVTRVRLEPITGRSHQLRVHCAFGREITGLAAPILGDTLYHPDPKAPRLMLHAAELGFAHPSDGRRVRFEDPADFMACVMD